MEIEADKVISAMKEIIADQAQQIAVLKAMLAKLQESDT